MHAQHSEIEYCLNAIEFELRRLHYWQDIPPSKEKLASVLPFCVDTLEFPQWLQFIFISKMRILLKSGAPLPTACNISAYAEEYFIQDDKDTDILLKHLLAIDKLLTSE